MGAAAPARIRLTGGDHVRKPELDYRYEFAPHELDAIVACNEAHGFCVVQGLLPDATVAMLRRQVRRVVDPDHTLGPGQSRTHTSFIETATQAWSLLEYEPFMALHRALLGTGDMVINRSAAIIRNPGSEPVGWHSDWCGFSQGPPANSGDVLNRGPWPSGKWFYITGSRPSHGGLCVIAGSHVEDWPGPQGFHLTQDRRSFYPDDGGGERRYSGFDIPGLVPLFAEPGDCIVFAHRTYHGAFGNNEGQPRLSCAIGFRQRQYVIDPPWELSPTARAFVASLPAHLQRYVDGYPGIDPAFKGAAAA